MKYHVGIPFLNEGELCPNCGKYQDIYADHLLMCKNKKPIGERMNSIRRHNHIKFLIHDTLSRAKRSPKDEPSLNDISVYCRRTLPDEAWINNPNMRVDILTYATRGGVDLIDYPLRTRSGTIS